MKKGLMFPCVLLIAVLSGCVFSIANPVSGGLAVEALTESEARIFEIEKEMQEEIQKLSFISACSVTISTAEGENPPETSLFVVGELTQEEQAQEIRELARSFEGSIALGEIFVFDQLGTSW